MQETHGKSNHKSAREKCFRSRIKETKSVIFSFSVLQLSSDELFMIHVSILYVSIKDPSILPCTHIVHKKTWHLYVLI